MTRPARTLAAASTAALGLVVAVAAPPAAAYAPAAPTPSAPGKALSCPIEVVGVTADQHLVMRAMDKGTVGGERRSADPLPFDPVALGYHSSKSLSGGYRLRMDAPTAGGRPRLLTVRVRTGSDTLAVSVKRMQQTGFRPRLFADSADYRVYTVSRSGRLQRWLLTKAADGALRFARRVNLATGYDNVTALAMGSRQKWGGRWRDVLFATTTTGRLKEIVVPLDKPKKLRTYTLARTGYADVTGLSTATCQGKASFSLVIAVDNVANTATWTTVKGTHRPRAAVTRLRGPAGVGEDWVLHALW